MAFKRWILILAALPAFAGSERPFNPGDVLVTQVGVSCGPHFSTDGFGVALHRGGSVTSSRFGPENYRYPTPAGAVTYSPALNRMILPAFGIQGIHNTLESMDPDGHLTPWLTLPERAKVTALAGVGREILAVVVLSAPYRFELWRIAADGTAIEKIGLPFSPPPLAIRDITSIDVAADRCTLAYVVPGEVVHRYDICARRPLEDVATRPAWAVHFLPQGTLLVVEVDLSGVPSSFPASNGVWSRLARYDREGRLVSMFDLPQGVSVSGIALDPDGSTAWIVTGGAHVGCFGGSLMAVNASSGALIAGPWFGGGTGIAVAGEWRAAEHPPVRDRAIRH